MKISAIVILFAILLCGCAAKMAWYNPYKTEQEFYRDLAKCETMANSAYMSNIGQQPNIWGMTATTNARMRLFNACMMGEGWSLEKQR